jgi:zona occludens toxin
MITLITGGPGTGKTAWLIDQLLELRRQEPDREIYIHGIRHLRNFPHEAIYCNSQLCDICRGSVIPSHAKYVEDWMHWKPMGALIVVDEVQRIWRPSYGSTSSASLPESIAGLETHRHYGLDFWLISQGPHLFHNFIRLLVGRHVHLVAKWSGRSQYEWPECKQNIASRSDAVVRPYQLPSRVFAMYDSAELHTKQEKRKPLSFYAMIIALVLAVVATVFVVKRIKARITPPPISVGSPTGGVGDAAAAPPAPPSPVSLPSSSTPEGFPDFEPKIPGVPESAPAYAGLVKVKAAPLLVGCVYNKSKDLCTCYTQQATHYPASQSYCIETVKNHRFNPYFERVLVNENGVKKNLKAKETSSVEPSIPSPVLTAASVDGE